MSQFESQVQFQNRSRKWLRGMIHRPSRFWPRKRAPGVVFFHGFTGDRMESHWMFVKCARALAEHGMASLRFDFYGSGESEGEFREVTLHGEIEDAKAAIEFFRRRVGVDPECIGLLGLSMGGAVAACVAESARAQALVLWSALAHPSQLRLIAEIKTAPIADDDDHREYNAHVVSKRFLDDIEKVDPLKSIADFTRPTLIIHPEKDEHLPLSHPEGFFQAAGSAVKEKVIIPGADHTFTSVAWEREVIKRTVKWFSTHLAHPKS